MPDFCPLTGDELLDQTLLRVEELLMSDHDLDEAFEDA